MTLAGRGRPRRYCGQTCRKRASRARANASIPSDLTSRPRWIRHAHKRPITPAGWPASVTDPSTWGPYAAAASSKVGTGLGFVLGEGVGCLDFDHVIRDGVLDPEVAALIASLPPTYVEVSPSGEGLHVWGMIPEAPGRVLTIGGVRVERYSRARYLTVTEVPWRSSVARLADLSDTLQWT